MLATIPSEWTRLAPSPRPLSPGEEWNVFLSYRSVNRGWVLNLYDVLRGLGHKVFLDQVALAPGQPLLGHLQESLAKSQAGVLIWTRDSDSAWVRTEFEAMEQLAISRSSFCFVPLRVDNSQFPLFVGNRVFLDFSSYPDGPNGGELLRLLHAITGQPLSDEAAHFAAEQDEAAAVAMARITAATKNNWPQRLLALFEEGGLPWETSATPGCKVAEGLTRLNRNAEAVEVLAKVERHFPRAVRPRQLHALALARTGEFAAAQDILGELYARGERDPETVGMYARTWTDRYYATQPRDLNYLRQSRDYYLEAFTAVKDDYYTGINAAAKSVLIGESEDLERAADLAREVMVLVGTERQPDDDYFKLATRGEVFLIQQDYAEAARWYQMAVASARWETGSQRSTWLQACRLMAKLRPTEAERALIRDVFRDQPDCTGLPVD
jgi:TIR domain/Tetratricopeptide Repeats-Sensor